MAENLNSENPLADFPNKKPERRYSESLTLWIGIVSTIVTLALTAWNTYTKSKIDQREKDLESLELKLKERSTGVEESKERVDRYKWVFSLFPSLTGSDSNEKNFTINLIRLALTKDEAEQLFTGLQSSDNVELQAVGKSGITVIQNEPITILVSQMNANTADVRKSAVSTLIRNYKSSSQAISVVLRTYAQGGIETLSPSGNINSLYFLASTDPLVWSKEQLVQGNQIVNLVLTKNPGNQTREAVNNFQQLLKKAEANRKQ